MMKFKRFHYPSLSAVVSIVIMLAGCTVANTVVDPRTRLRIEPAININPDSRDRPSPLVLRVYQLAARNAFQNSDFFNLYDHGSRTLDQDLIAVEEIVVRPGKVHKHSLRLNRQTRYIGIMAAFRDIENAQWRLVTEADPQDYDKIEIRIDRLTLQRID